MGPTSNPRPSMQTVRPLRPKPSASRAPAPPPASNPAFVPPTVTWSHLVSCKGTSAAWQFRALIDLTGGQSWQPATGNLQPVSGSRYSYTITGGGGGDGTTPAPPQTYTWSSTTLYNTSSPTRASFYKLDFPSKWIVRATCPS